MNATHEKFSPPRLLLVVNRTIRITNLVTASTSSQSQPLRLRFCMEIPRGDLYLGFSPISSLPSREDRRVRLGGFTKGSPGQKDLSGRWCFAAYGMAKGKTMTLAVKASFQTVVSTVGYVSNVQLRGIGKITSTREA